MLLQCVFQCQAARLLYYCVAAMYFSVKLTGCCIIVFLQCVIQCQADRLLYYCVAAMCVSVSSCQVVALLCCYNVFQC